MRTQPPTSLRDEADYWNNAYQECFGVWPDPIIGIGTLNIHVNMIQSAVMRYWAEKAKEAAGGKSDI